MIKSTKKRISILMILIAIFITTNVYADEYPDDIYDGDYSIEEMLQNYNVITFGKKELDSKMSEKIVGYVFDNYPNIEYTYLSQGDAAIFHVNSQFLINGTLHRRRIDLKKNNDSVKSSLISMSSFKNAFQPNYCGYTSGYGYTGCYDQKNAIYSINNGSYMANSNSPERGYVVGNYMNYDRLKDSIQINQNKIIKGKAIASQNRVAHIEIGGEYYIDDINEIDSIMFDNFENNQDKLTIITINNTGDIKFPIIYESNDDGEGSLVPTNDFIGMEGPANDYANYYVIDKYYGNIIWNIPNATYIELPSAPFIGHIIAPNADLYGPELHYAGAFLVNSLYLEGNSEAHFYPLTSTNIPYRSNPEPIKAKLKLNKSQGNILFKNNVNSEELEEGMVVSFQVEEAENYLLTDIDIIDEEENKVEYRKVGDKEYEFTMPATDVTITPQFKEKNIKNIIENVVTNPKTGRSFIIILIMGVISTITIYRKIKKEKIS